MSKQDQKINLHKFWKVIRQQWQSYTNSKISEIETFDQVVVQELPNVGKLKTLYFTPSSNPERGNVYDEFIYTSTGWEQVGSTAYVPDHTIEDKPTLGKLLVTLNPSTQNEAKYLVGRDPYTAPADPTFSPASGGSGNGSLAVTISCATSGATVKYSLDNGSTWTTGTSVTLNQDDSTESKSYTIKAKAVKSGLESNVVSASYTVKRKLSAPTIDNASGNKYAASRTVKITHATADTIYYTTDGSTPTTSSSTITSGSTITLSTAGTFTVKALAVKANWVNSSVAEKSGIVVGAKKCYIGRGGETLSALSGLTAVEADNLNGERTVTLASAGYIWFVVSSNATISSITSGPLSVPFALKANSVSGYNCYRTDLEITAGTYTYNIA